MPARFEVYYARGALVAEGEVEPGRGKALWKCTDIPPGMFILQVFDADYNPIATAEVVKR